MKETVYSIEQSRASNSLEHLPDCLTMSLTLEELNTISLLSSSSSQPYVAHSPPVVWLRYRVSWWKSMNVSVCASALFAGETKRSHLMPNSARDSWLAWKTARSRVVVLNFLLEEHPTPITRPCSGMDRHQILRRSSVGSLGNGVKILVETICRGWFSAGLLKTAVPLPFRN